MHNYAHIFELLARLRQALDHPYIVLHGPAAEAAAEAASAAQGCFDLCAKCNMQIASAKEVVVAGCKHAFHRDCAAELDDEASQGGGCGGPECPARVAAFSVFLDTRVSFPALESVGECSERAA